jgi:hypothetical protein
MGGVRGDSTLERDRRGEWEDVRVWRRGRTVKRAVGK